jgi:hypothetical protein
MRIRFRRRQFYSLCVLAALLSPLAGAAAAEELADDLQVLQAVEKFGKGNARAAAAWQRVTACRADALPTILAALDHANPIGANWIRAAVDTIAQRELSADGRLPMADLEAFVKNGHHAPQSRRLAFQWLTRVDASAAERLIPGMLDDPELEFRRAAIERLVSQAQREQDQNRLAAALPLYRRAFEKSRDLDQVKQLATRLRELGEQVDVARHLGFITTWKLIGPFDNAALRGFDAVYPPEQSYDPAAVYMGKNGEVRWIDHSTSDEYGMVDLNRALGKANGVAGYAAAEFIADDARPVDLRLGSGNAHKLWLNGRLVSQSASYHTSEQVDQFIAQGTLQRGKNVILLKVLQNEQKEDWAQDWHFQMRVCDRIGTAVLAGTRSAGGPASEQAAAR